MKELIKNIEAQNEIINRVGNWYQWCLDNAPYSVEGEGMTLVSAQIGKISSRQMSVKLNTVDANGNEFATYITPMNWWVKKVMSGTAYGGFSKKLVERVQSYHIEEAN